VSLPDWDRGNCSVGRALELIGDRHTMLVLREAFLSERRFDRIQRNTGIARNILSDRLNKLVAAGILSRRPYQERPLRYEYRLTEKGIDLWPILVALMEWGRRHGGGEQGSDSGEGRGGGPGVHLDPPKDVGAEHPVPPDGGFGLPDHPALAKPDRIATLGVHLATP
jgi:DNA-binding HxlR family transcriptional regulator